jgi:hypothetical protein
MASTNRIGMLNLLCVSLTPQIPITCEPKDVAFVWLGHLHTQKCSTRPKCTWGFYNYENEKCGLLAINQISPSERFINRYLDLTLTTLKLKPQN